MPCRRWRQKAGVRDVATVFEKIRQVAASGRSDSPRTCWNAIGLYLHQHPNTHGIICFYGADKDASGVVYHVVLTDKTGHILRDTQATSGGQQLSDGEQYQSPTVPDKPLVLMGFRLWP